MIACSRVIATCFAVTLTTATLSAAEQHKPTLRDQAKALFGPLPQVMPGAEVDSEAQRRLGKMLYEDKRLSSENNQSCASCHNVSGKGAGVDNLPTSPGAKGQLGERNSPTTLNAGFQFAQFWDGRAADLVEQAKGPILNPVEMAMPSSAAVIDKLSAITEYVAAFRAAFPNEKAPLNYDNLARAIATFERTLITKDRFDQWQNGDDEALSKRELEGLSTFIANGCATCHMGPLLGGQMYQKMGLIHAYETNDKGRAIVTGNPSDEYYFKVPSLRNVALTPPYFHDGKIANLEDAVAKMAHHQLGKSLSKKEIASIVAFLQSLSDIARQ